MAKSEIDEVDRFFNNKENRRASLFRPFPHIGDDNEYATLLPADRKNERKIKPTFKDRLCQSANAKLAQLEKFNATRKVGDKYRFE